MFNCGYLSSRAVVTSQRSFFTRFHLRLALMAALLVAGLGSVWATETDDRYYQIYGLIEKADAFSKEGQKDKALAKYVAAEKGLKELKQNYPLYNPKLISTRLNYLAEKITTISKPEAADVGDSATKGASSVSPALKAVVAGQPQVKLLEAGAEPRKAFRLQVKDMDKQKIRLTVKVSMGLSTPENSEQRVEVPMMSLGAVVSAKSISPGGDIAYEVLIDDVNVVAEPGGIADVSNTLKASLATMNGLIINGLMTDRYLSKKNKVIFPSATDIQIRERMEGVEDTFANTKFILPEEAVGVGAKWEVKQKTKKRGMSVDETTRHELTSINGDLIVVTSTVSEIAANQKIPNPFVPSMTVNLTTMAGTATETATINLTKILPIKVTADETTEVKMGIPKAGKKQTLTMKTKTHTTLEME